jgi:hypothetical protein
MHNEELHNLYTSPNIIRVIKSTRMRWEGHVGHMAEMGEYYNETYRNRLGGCGLHSFGSG